MVEKWIGRKGKGTILAENGLAGAVRPLPFFNPSVIRIYPSIGCFLTTCTGGVDTGEIDVPYSLVQNYLAESLKPHIFDLHIIHLF